MCRNNLVEIEKNNNNDEIKFVLFVSYFLGKYVKINWNV